jgi:acyl carrier protein
MEHGLEREITTIVAEIIEMEEDELWNKREAHFVNELDVDSMLALEMLAVLEKKYKITIPEENILDLTSLQSTIDLVRSKLDRSSAS